ncbi:MAG: hypothetical protein MUF87_07005 [Anaerolineae bacterium]|jgi:hypothetical protein|nr:hypothetical protein [Anaerolineae bacterium]
MTPTREVSRVVPKHTTITPSPTLTPIPEILGEIPLTFADHDLAIANDPFVLQLTEVKFLRQVEGLTLPEGKVYVVLRRYLYNYGDQDQVFHDADFWATFGEQPPSPIMPNPDVMHKIQAAYYPNTGYPDFVVSANDSREIILVYEVPDYIYQIDLSFTP